MSPTVEILSFILERVNKKLKMKLLKLKTLDDFTKKEIEKFGEMRRVLTAYNASIGTKNELPLPR